MPTDREIADGRAALFDALEQAGAARIGGMVVYGEVPVSVRIGVRPSAIHGVLKVALIHGKNWPKVFIEEFGSLGFHAEFSVRWQTFTYSDAGILRITGASQRFPSGYEVSLKLTGVEVSREA